MTDLVKRLREDAGFDGQKLLAADALEAAIDRIAALTVKCELLAASLDKADREADALQASLDRLHGTKFSSRDYAALVDRAERNEVDANRYRWLRRGLHLTVCVPVKDKEVIYYIGNRPEPDFGSAFDAAIDAALSATKEQG